MYLRISSVMLIFLVLFSCAQQETRIIPREILFGNPEKVAPRLSPDGKMLTYLAPEDGVLNVWIRTIGKYDDRVITADTLRGIRRYFWAEDSEHIIYLQDKGGNENWRVYTTNINTKETKDLTPFENTQARIIEKDRHYPDEIYISLNKRDPKLHDVYRLNIKTGTLTKSVENPGNVTQWLVDAEFNVRGAFGTLPDGGNELLVRIDDKSPWKQVALWGPDDNASYPFRFTKDGKSIYINDSRDANALRLIKLNIETGGQEVLAEDAVYDVANIFIHPESREIQATSFYKAREEWIVLDDSIKTDFENIKKLNQGELFINSRDHSDNLWLVGFSKDNGPVPYYIYNRTTKRAAYLFVHRPKLSQYKLVKMEPISYKTRDDYTIHGYLTRPPGKTEKLPLVLNVHGGPWARDYWGYNAEAQWLANRGYACLQVNFRGSTGYGKDFLNAGNREWGAKMHDDLIDAVKWAITEGIADSNKIAIYGGSYGGYAALVGAAFTPDVFCCAIDIVGPSNLVTLINSIPPYWAPMRKFFDIRVGNVDTEKEFLESRSPLFKADQIEIPLLIAQGANDPRVKQAESEQIIEELKKHEIEYEYLLFPDEGHGFVRPENRLKFYAVAEKFLAKHMGGRFESNVNDSMNKAVQSE